MNCLELLKYSVTYLLFITVSSCGSNIFKIGGGGCTGEINENEMKNEKKVPSPVPDT